MKQFLIILTIYFLSPYTFCQYNQFRLKNNVLPDTISSYDFGLSYIDYLGNGDLNGDGLEDIIVSGSSQTFYNVIDTIHKKSFVFINDGMNNFILDPINTLTQYTFESAELVDIDGDGDLDFATICRDRANFYNTPPSFKLFENNGGGNFSEVLNHNINFQPTIHTLYDVRCFDIENDGDQEIIVGFYGPLGHQYQLYKNSGGLNFSNISAVNNAVEFESADLNNDNYIDLIFSIEDGTNSIIRTEIFINDGTGNFSSIPNTLSGFIGDLAVGHINNDNFLDIYSQGEDYFGNPGHTFIINQNGVNFNSIPSIIDHDLGSLVYSPIGLTRYNCRLFDIDGDSDDDLFISDNNKSIVYENIGNTRMRQYQSIKIDTSSKSNFFFLDLNDDGNNDIVVSSGKGVRTFIGNREYKYLESDFSDFSGIDQNDCSYGDVDGDGDIDILISGRIGSARSTRVYVNDGTGNYLIQSLPGVENVLGKARLVDIDGDQDLDIYLMGYGTTTLYRSLFYKNDGSGNFSLFSSGQTNILSTQAIHFFDCDGDLDNDLIISGQDSLGLKRTLHYINDGVGNFSLHSNVFDGFTFGVFSSGDVDGDNDVDLFVSGFDQSSNIKGALYLNDGSGNYTVDPSHVFDSLRSGQAIFLDIDNDFDLDFIQIGNSNDPQIFITKSFENDGSGNFTLLSNSFSEGLNGVSLDTSDVNYDGFIDLIICGRLTTNNPQTKILLNDSNGGFYRIPDSLQIKSVYDGSAKFFDADLDGDKDVFIIGDTSALKQFGRLYLRDMDISFYELNFGSVDGFFYGDITSGDIDGDGDLDIVTVGGDEHEIVRTIVYENDGDGNYIEKPQHQWFPQYGNRGNCKLLDVDNDGDLDLHLSGAGSPNGNEIHFNDGTGYFGASGPSSTMSSRIEARFDYADINADGFIDILATNPLEMFINDGNGSFSSFSGSNLPNINSSYPIDIAFIDAEGDGDKDIVIVGQSALPNDTTIICINDGSGFYTTSNMSNSIPLNTPQITVGDLDGDTDIDIVMQGTYSGSQIPYTNIYLNNGSGNFSLYQEFEEASIAGEVVLEDIDNDGDLDLFMTGKNSTRLCYNDGTGFFTPLTGNVFSNLYRSSAEILDIDGDLDKDIVYGGSIAWDGPFGNPQDPNRVICQTRIYENTICSPAIHFDTIEVCETFVSIGGIIFNSDTSGIIVTFPFAASNGCDSIVEKTIIFQTSYDTINFGTFCDSVISPSGNQVFFSSGTYVDTLINQHGCDSLLTLNVSVSYSNQTTIDIFSCDSIVVPSGNYIIYSAGLYYDTLLNTNNCDSILFINADIRSHQPNTYLSNDTLLTDSILGVNYHWFNCDNSFLIPGFNDYYYTPILNGNYSVIISDSICYDTSNCINIQVCPILFIDILNSTNPATGQSNGTIEVEAHSGSAPYSYLWSNGPTGTVNSNIGAGAYQVIVEDDDMCSGNRLIQLYDVDTSVVVNPVQDTLVSDTMDICVPFNYAVSFIYDFYIDSLDTTILHINWVFLDADSNVYLANVPYDIDSTFDEGNYFAILNMECVDGNDNKVNEVIYDIFYYSDHQSNLGLNDQLINQVKIYPNPTTGSITINIGSIKPHHKVVVRTIEGKLVEEFDFDSQENQVVIDGVPGTYIVEVQTRSGILVRKIVKK
ncbi:MAG: VCBS repeat-containing protein [Crocinitomicaceae bacterium]|nr:VCBS repeat-containing protein [Crocinitomicaceae bacterium]